LWCRAANIPGAWILSPPPSCTDAPSCNVITSAGHPYSSAPADPCGQKPNLGSGLPLGSGQPNGSGRQALAVSRACDAYIASLHLRQTVIYQPASRFWAFQW